MTCPDPSAADELLAPANLAEARKVCDAATPGPWGTYKSLNGWHYSTPAHPDGIDHVRKQRLPDAEFIALARTLLPALIDRVEALRTSLDSAHEHRRVVQVRADEAEAEVERLRADALTKDEAWLLHLVANIPTEHSATLRAAREKLWRIAERQP